MMMPLHDLPVQLLLLPHQQADCDDHSNELPVSVRLHIYALECEVHQALRLMPDSHFLFCPDSDSPLRQLLQDLPSSLTQAP